LLYASCLNRWCSSHTYWQ